MDVGIGVTDRACNVAVVKMAKPYVPTPTIAQPVGENEWRVWHPLAGSKGRLAFSVPWTKPFHSFFETGPYISKVVVWKNIFL